MVHLRFTRCGREAHLRSLKTVPVGLTKGGALTRHGGSLRFAGGNVFNDAKRFITSKPARKVIRFAREKVITPLARDLAPSAVDAGIAGLKFVPGVGPVLSGVATLARQPIIDGVQKGITEADALAFRSGFGLQQKLEQQAVPPIKASAAVMQRVKKARAAAVAAAARQAKQGKGVRAAV